MAEKSKRGFASMDPQLQKKIASKGGKSAHAQGKAHTFTSDEAKMAGHKGGKSSRAQGVGHSFTSEEARAAGRKGGLSRKKKSK